MLAPAEIRDKYVPFSETCPLLMEVPIKDYHASTGVGSSNVGEILEDLPGFMAGVSAFDEMNDNFLLGQMVHDGLLSPHLYESSYAVFDGKVRRGKKWDEFKVNCEQVGMEPVTLKLKDQAEAMLKAMSQNDLVLELMDNSNKVCEGSGWVVEPSSGILCKVRPDLLTWDSELNGWFVTDLKTASNSHWKGVGKYSKGFEFSVRSYGYNRQQCFYTDLLTELGMNILGFSFLVVGKSKPYDIFRYYLPQAWVDDGRAEYKEQLDRYKRALIYG